MLKMKIYQCRKAVCNSLFSRETLIFCMSAFFNVLFFLTVIARNPPNWYTNDDFRMMTIVSGVYSGTPSPDIIFMRYPIGILLSGLYQVTTNIPWYGLFTMLCMYIPSCVFCYYIIKKAYEKNRIFLGIILYLLLFVFFIQKYICLPQFTLTSAFLGVGAFALLHEMPDKNNKKHIVSAALFAALSFSIRSKAFYLILPAILWVIAVRVFKDNRNKRKYILWSVFTFIMCMAVLISDMAAWSRPEYAEFKKFKEVRAEIYDYGSIPGYYENMPFYKENGVSEVTYRAISGRFLDVDESVNTETLTLISSYMKQVRSVNKNIIKRISEAVKNGISNWYYASDQTIKYCAILVTVLFFLCIAMSVKKRKADIIFPFIVAGMILEITFLEFNGRVMARLIDLMMLTMSVSGCFAIIELSDKRTETFAECAERLKKDKVKSICLCGLLCAVFIFVMVGICNMQDDLDNKSLMLRKTTNSKTEALMQYAAKYPESFFFYDTNDFMSSTGYVFQTYEKHRVLNNESMGSWNTRSPLYYERNRKFGFETAIEGLTRTDKEVYFITTASPKMGIAKTLKDLYNKKLTEVDKIQTAKDILYVYMVTDDE